MRTTCRKLQKILKVCQERGLTTIDLNNTSVFRDEYDRILKGKCLKGLDLSGLDLSFANIESAKLNNANEVNLHCLKILKYNMENCNDENN